MTVLLPLLLALAAPVQAPTAMPPLATAPEPMVVRVHFPEELQRVDGDLGPVANLLVNRELSQQFYALPKQLTWLRAQVPGFDLDARLAERLACAIRVDGVCTGAVVIDGVGSEPGLSPPPKRTLHLTFFGATTGFNVQAVYVETDGAATPTTLRAFRFWHEAHNCAGARGNPLAAYDDATPDGRARTLALCWFDGAPSRFETMVDTVLAELVGLTTLPGVEFGPNGVPLTDFAWAQALPTVQSLEDAGLSRCRGAACRWPLVWHRDGRMVAIPNAHGGTAWLLSKPLAPP